MPEVQKPIYCNVANAQMGSGLAILQTFNLFSIHLKIQLIEKYYSSELRINIGVLSLCTDFLQGFQ